MREKGGRRSCLECQTEDRDWQEQQLTMRQRLARAQRKWALERGTWPDGRPAYPH